MRRSMPSMRSVTRRHTRHIPAILLVNRDNKDQIQRAKVHDHRILLPLDLKIKDLRASLLQLLREEEPSSS